MEVADAGTPIVITTNLQKYDIPNETYTDQDADSDPTITVVDKKGNVKVDAASMTNYDTGKYYYIVVNGGSVLILVVILNAVQPVQVLVIKSFYIPPHSCSKRI